jgi:hypothetical protein
MNLGVQSQIHIVFTQRADGFGQMNLSAVEMNLELLLQLLGNLSGRDRAEHLAIIAGLHVQHGDELRDALGKLAHGVELVRLALGPALAQRFEAMSIPLLVVFRDGAPVDRIVGALPRAQLAQRRAPYLSG